MSEVYAICLLDALDGAVPHIRSHDGKHLIGWNVCITDCLWKARGVIVNTCGSELCSW